MNAARQYLRAIYLIQELEDGRASTGAVAEMLDVSPASANEMIGKLEADGFCNHKKYRGVDLTDDGIVRARESLQDYCTLERFLANVLAVESYREEAAQLEPVIDEVVADRLDTLVNRREVCPDCFDPDTGVCAVLDVDSAPGVGVDADVDAD